MEYVDCIFITEVVTIGEEGVITEVVTTGCNNR